MFLSVMKRDQGPIAVATHPTIGDIFVGDFVVLNNSSIGRICGAQDHMISVQLLYRPHELLARISPKIVPKGRRNDSFASNELVLGTKTESASLADVFDKVVVLTMDQVVNPTHKPASDQWFFYRQVVDDNTWHLEPVLIPRVLLPDGSIVVENPEIIYTYCDCKGDAVLYPTKRRRAAVGDVETGYEQLICQTCQTIKQANNNENDSTSVGQRWLEESLHAAEPTRDPKRLIVIEKFAHALQLGLNENDSDTLVIGTGDVVRQFCVDLEDQIHRLNIEKPRDYKARVFTLTFNLSDSKNTSLRRRIVQGQFSPAELAVATADQLASDDLKEKRKEQRDKYFSTHVVHRPEEVMITSVQQPLQKKVRSEVPKPVQPFNISIVPPPAVNAPEPDQTSIQVSSGTQAVQAHIPEEVPLSKPATQSSGAHSKLIQFATKLKTSLSNINNECLRRQAIDFVDYYLRHSSDTPNHT